MVGLALTVTPSTALADSEGGVVATVTAGLLCVTAEGQNLDYGTVDLDTTGNLPTGQTSASSTEAAFRVENCGTGELVFDIIGGPSAGWDIAASSTFNTYAHFYDDGASSSGTPLIRETLSQSTELATGVSSSTPIFVWLELDMPTGSSATSTEQSLPIGIVATRP